MNAKSLPSISGGLTDTMSLRAIASEVSTPYSLLAVDSRMSVDITPRDFERMVRVMEMTGASIVYSDYRILTDDSIENVECIDYAPGALREDFDFGPVVLVDSRSLKMVTDELPQLRFAAWTDARLRLSRLGRVVHIPEMLYTAKSSEKNEQTAGESQFAYVDPRNREVQIEMERVVTDHLKAIGAWLPPRTQQPDFGDEFPVMATIVIPVRNRVNTIADAIFSALDQCAPFDFNVIVVDNHSTDGTSEVISRLTDDPRLICLIPEEKDLGIGGCWNLAVNHPACGRFVIQLDSDDIYSSTETLKAIVDCFQREKCAMVVGSYSLTDINLKPIPPGVIDHKEWTDENGHNNLLRVNGLGAPRAFATAVARQYPFPDVSYGEDYAMGLQISRFYRIGRIFDVLYLCRRWSGNSDASLSRDKANRYNRYKDTLRTWEIDARRQLNRDSDV